MKHIIPQTVQIVEDEHQKSFPRIVANIESRDNHHVLMDELAKRGYGVLSSRNSEIYHLTLRKMLASSNRARIPAELTNSSQNQIIKGTKFSMLWAEIGGWDSHVSEAENFAVVVCDSDGNKLRPFHVTNYTDCGSAFEFSFDLGVPAVTVESSCREMITIEEHTLELHLNHELVSVKSLTLWSGKAKELPGELSRFAEAVKAAADKAMCQHCTKHLHFGVEPGKH